MNFESRSSTEVRVACAASAAHLTWSPLLMRIALNIAAALCLLVGCIWFLQGINLLPGSFMTGQTKWAVYGGLLFVVGLGFLTIARRRRA